VQGEAGFMQPFARGCAFDESMDADIPKLRNLRKSHELNRQVIGLLESNIRLLV
jgi:hypothetical protein